jgi:hypothetical protein
VAVNATNGGPLALVVNSFHNDVHQVTDGGIGNLVIETASNPRDALLVVDNGESRRLDMCGDLAISGEII